MGIFYETVGIGSLAGGNLAPVSALVDTGASYTILPSALLTEMGIASHRQCGSGLPTGGR